jgi:hypothetical protein
MNQGRGSLQERKKPRRFIREELAANRIYCVARALTMTIMMMGGGGFRRTAAGGRTRSPSSSSTQNLWIHGNPWGWAEMAVRSVRPLSLSFSSLWINEWSRASKADPSAIPPRGKCRSFVLCRERERETNVHGRAARRHALLQPAV